MIIIVGGSDETLCAISNLLQYDKAMNRPKQTLKLSLVYIAKYDFPTTCFLVGYPVERRERTRRFAGNSSFYRRDAFKVLTPTSTYRQFVICMFYLSELYTKQDFVFKYHILQCYLQC